MEISEHVKEFRALQKSQMIRVADSCREHVLDCYEMVEALKRDKFLSEMPEEQVEAAELEITDLPLDHPDPSSTVHYTLAEWQGIVRYTTNGNYRADNNYTEQIMRDLATGRKNFLFSGSDNAAKNLAFAYSLTQSCKLCKINPYDYWEDLLANSMSPNRQIDSFMPHLWKKSH